MIALHTPPENEYQLLHVSYGWHEGTLYKRTLYPFEDGPAEMDWHALAPWACVELADMHWHASESRPDVPRDAWTACDEPGLGGDSK